MTHSTVFIHDTPLHVADPRSVGQQLTPYDAEVLNSIALRRFIGRMQAWLRRNPEPSTIELTEFATTTALAVATFDSTAGDETDPIREEAMALGRELLLSRLAADNLPAPTNLDAHVEELVDAVPELTDQARRRVEIRRATIARTLNALEVVP